MKKLITFALLLLPSVLWAVDVTTDPTPFGYAKDEFGPKDNSLTFSAFVGILDNAEGQQFPQGVSKAQNLWRYGIRLGYSITQNFDIEAHLGYTPTTNNLNDLFIYDTALMGAFDIPISRFIYLYGMMGPGAVHYRLSNVGNTTDFSGNIGAGIKAFVFKNLHVRAEFLGIATFDDFNFAIAPNVGITYYFQSQQRRKDRDRDGILNEVDQCPDQPETFNDYMDQDGCPEDPNDLDGDGIANNLDQCPQKPETVNGAKDDDGCPEDPNDIDEDGIPNAQDQCPKDAETVNGYLDEDGCPENPDDWDGDKINNDVDQCPQNAETVNGVKDEDGCPENPDDWDGDGIKNDEDQCPKDPETINGLDDTDGCPDKVPNDSDNDGVRDDIDQCPGEKEIYNNFKDEDGCPDHELDEFSGVVDGIHFNVGKSSILVDSYAKLNKGAELFQAYPMLTFVIEGHTDSTGPLSVNDRLAKERALSVQNYLAKQGIDMNRMTIEAYGPRRPIADNTTEEGRARNRRIEFRLENLEEVKKIGRQ